MSSLLMAALEQFEAAEANLVKLERLSDEISGLIPSGVAFGQNPEYEDRARSYGLLLAAMPEIDGWKPTMEPRDLDDVAQSRFDAMESYEPSAQISVERWIEEPGRELREYRFRLHNKRRALIRDALVGLIDQIDADLRAVREVAGYDPEANHQLDPDVWADLREHIKQIEVLLGSSVTKPDRWSDMMRHIRFGHVGDLHDIEALDWPSVKAGLRKRLYGATEAVPVQVKDLGSLVASRPAGPITTKLAWPKLDDETFERLGGVDSQGFTPGSTCDSRLQIRRRQSCIRRSGWY